MVERYGKETVSTWYWEVWNEPDGKYYWKGTEDEYNQLYDYGSRGRTPGDSQCARWWTCDHRPGPDAGQCL